MHSLVRTVVAINEVGVPKKLSDIPEGNSLERDAILH